MELLDNVNSKLKDDLTVQLKKGSKVSIAAAYFSIYAYQELRKQLESIEELRFIFTSSTFLKKKNKKESREFYIPRLNRERSIYGTEFEVKLRNEMTQKAIARECAEVNAVARALNHGADLEGASISVSNVRGPNSTSGLCGTFDEPCNVCQALLDMFGIRVVSY